MLAIVCERSMQFLLGSHDILCRCLTIFTSILSSTMHNLRSRMLKGSCSYNSCTMKRSACVCLSLSRSPISWKILKVDLAL